MLAFLVVVQQRIVVAANFFDSRCLLTVWLSESIEI